PPRSLHLGYSSAPATPVSYSLSLHDALPIFGGAIRGRVLQRLSRRHSARARGARRAAAGRPSGWRARHPCRSLRPERRGRAGLADRKSTRLNSSHVKISYAVFCLKKKKKKND